MIFYNWKSTVQVLGKNPEQIVNYFRWLTNLRKASKSDLKKYMRIDKGTSFILHLREVLTSGASNNEIVTYLSLCSKRDFLHYRRTQDTTLDIAFIEDNSIVQRNSLLTELNGRVHFKYEE